MASLTSGLTLLLASKLCRSCSKEVSAGGRGWAPDLLLPRWPAGEASLTSSMVLPVSVMGSDGRSSGADAAPTAAAALEGVALPVDCELCMLLPWCVLSLLLLVPPWLTVALCIGSECACAFSSQAVMSMLICIQLVRQLCYLAWLHARHVLHLGPGFLGHLVQKRCWRIILSYCNPCQHRFAARADDLEALHGTLLALCHPRYPKQTRSNYAERFGYGLGPGLRLLKKNS